MSEPADPPPVAEKKAKKEKKEKRSKEPKAPKEKESGSSAAGGDGGAPSALARVTGKESSGGSRVRVAVRVRPHNRADKGNTTTCVDVDGPKLTIDNKETRPQSFTYDHVFKEADQKDVYQAIGADMLDDAFKGYNTTVFAYGQTGSGKTYSLLGANDGKVPEQWGLLPRICEDLFQIQEGLLRQDSSLSIKIQVSFMEVYNEQVHDLLQFEGKSKKPKAGTPLDVLKINAARKGKKGREFHVDGLSSHTAMNWSRIRALIAAGTDYRAKSDTDMNEVSSRSHSVFTIYINQSHDPPSAEHPDKASKITVVDLAGSERQSKTGVAEDAKKLSEANNINSSLMTLGRCLEGCAKGQTSDKLPVRDSALTKILCDIFGGNSKTTMFATISPSPENYAESLSTLKYADNAKKIKNQVSLNYQKRQLEIGELKEQLKQMAQQMVDELEQAAKIQDSLQKELDQSNKERDAALKRVQELEAQLANGGGGGGMMAGGMPAPGIQPGTVDSQMAARQAGENTPPHSISPAAMQSPTSASSGAGTRDFNAAGGTLELPSSHPTSTPAGPDANGVFQDMYRREDEDQTEDPELQRKLEEVQGILMNTLHVINPSLPNKGGGSGTLPNTARAAGEPPSALPTVRGGGTLVGASSEIRSYIGHNAAVYSCSFSPDGKSMVSASRDRTIKIWDVARGSEIQTLKGHSGFVLSCEFSPDGATICSASDDKTLRTWDASTGKKLQTFKGHTDKVYSCVFSRDGQNIASASCDRTVKIWSADSGKKQATLKGHTSAVFSVAFANNNPNLVVSASDDKTLRTWDWTTSEQKTEFQGHAATVWSCTFSPDDSEVLSASMDGTIKLWAVDTAYCIRTYRGHTAPVHYAIFAKGGDRIVSASRDRTLKVWDKETSKVLSTLIGHSNTVYHCSVFNSLILSCSSDDILKVWNLKV